MFILKTIISRYIVVVMVIWNDCRLLKLLITQQKISFILLSENIIICMYKESMYLTIQTHHCGLNNFVNLERFFTFI